MKTYETYLSSGLDKIQTVKYKQLLQKVTPIAGIHLYVVQNKTQSISSIYTVKTH